MTDLVVTLTGDKSHSSNVTIAFTMACKALEKGYNVDIILFSKSVYLAKRGYARQIDIGEPFSSLGELLSTFLEKGGKLKVCEGCMVYNGVEKENLIEGAVVIGSGDVIDSIMDSKKSLQFN